MSEIVLSRRDEALWIRIAREAKGNLLTLTMIGELEEAIRQTGDAKVVVLLSAGPDFCLGRDPLGNPASPTALDIRDNLIRPILSLYEAIATAPAPVVCAVQGRAAGLGCALATACDITIAAENALFRLPEMEKNLPPTLAISAMMAKVPRKTLAWLVYRMIDLDARDARLFGLVSEVVPADSLEDATKTLVRRLSERPLDALATVKEYLRSAPEMSPRAASDFAASLLASVLSSSRS
jgi:enoyl-CoA hydratase